MFDQALQDVRFGARILRTSPGLSATAIVLIALFIGGNADLLDGPDAADQAGPRRGRPARRSRHDGQRARRGAAFQPPRLSGLCRAVVHSPAAALVGFTVVHADTRKRQLRTPWRRHRRITSTRWGCGSSAAARSPTRKAASRDRAWSRSSATPCGTSTSSALTTSWDANSRSMATRPRSSVSRRRGSRDRCSATPAWVCGCLPSRGRARREPKRRSTTVRRRRVT